MSIHQLLLAGQGEIEPTVPIGGTIFTGTDSRTWPGNGYSYLDLHEVWTVPDRWAEKTYNYKAQITSSASYTCIGFNIQLYVNGVLVANWSTSASNESYFRYNSGTLTYNKSISVKAGDVVEARVYITGRNVGGTTPNAVSFH